MVTIPVLQDTVLAKTTFDNIADLKQYVDDYVLLHPFPEEDIDADLSMRIDSLSSLSRSACTNIITRR